MTEKEFTDIAATIFHKAHEVSLIFHYFFPTNHINVYWMLEWDLQNIQKKGSLHTNFRKPFSCLSIYWATAKAAK